MSVGASGIVDLDNDGLPDLFWVTGSTFPEVEREASGVSAQDAAGIIPQSRAAADSKSFWMPLVRRSPKLTPAVVWHLATSITMATSIF